MKLSRIIQLGCFGVLLSASAYANGCGCLCQSAQVAPISSNFGTASFSAGPDLWYTIETNSYPETVSLSQKRNKGLAEGAVYLSPTGFTIGEAGNYWVTVTAVLQNPTDSSTVLIPVYLVVDEAFNPDDPSPIGGVVTLESGVINTVQGTGVLQNVVPGSRLSLVATNAGYPMPVPITIVSWSISLVKMP